MKPNHYASMRKMILASMIIVPAIPFVIALLTGYTYFSSTIEKDNIAAMSRTVGDHRQMVDSFLNDNISMLRFILNSYEIKTLSNPEMLGRIFQNLQRETAALVDMGLFNSDGIHINYRGPYELSGKIYKNETWFRNVLKNGVYISNIFLGFRNVPHFIIAVSKDYGDDKYILRATIDTFFFNDLVRGVKIGKTGEAYLLNSSGMFQTGRRSGGDLMTVDPDHTHYPPYHDSVKTFIQKGSGGHTYLYASSWMNNGNWQLIVRQKKDDAFKELKNALYDIIIIMILGGAGIIALAFYMTDRIIRRIKQTDFEKVKLEEQLIRAGRLAEIGKMATGFAHEINNPLQIIKSEHALMELLVSDIKSDTLPEDEKATAEKDFEDSMKQISLQISRCAKITQAILKFGRQDEPKFQKMDLKTFIPEIMQMVEKKAKVNGISLVRDFTKDTPEIEGDPAQLQQVLLNLFNNAFDAISDARGNSGGNVLIKTSSENGHVTISVKDNGSGISDENMEKIFSPFFTTKPVGKGTGLGLSVCYGIIENMGGSIKVNSEKNKGTEFIIELPASLNKKA